MKVNGFNSRLFPLAAWHDVPQRDVSGQNFCVVLESASGVGWAVCAGSSINFSANCSNNVSSINSDNGFQNVFGSYR